MLKVLGSMLILLASVGFWISNPNGSEKSSAAAL